MYDRKSVTVTKEVIAECAKRTGKPVELIEEMYNLHVKYVQKLTRETPDAVNVRLPALGVLRLNRYLALRYRTLYDKCNEVLNSKIQILSDVIENYGWEYINFKKPALKNQYVMAFNHRADAVLQKFYSVFKELETKINYEYNRNYKKSDKKQVGI